MAINYTISNLGLDRRMVLLGGVDETRKYLADVGASGGLSWTPVVRSRLYAEVLAAGLRGNFVNTVGGVSLFGSMNQSFAPTVPEAIARLTSYPPSMPWRERVGRLAINIIQERGIMPPVKKSLRTLGRVAKLVGSDTFFANFYAEALGEGEVLDDTVAPYTRCAQLTPDLVEGLGVSMNRLPGRLHQLGITNLSFSTYNAERRSLSGADRLEDWRGYLEDYASRGLIRQVVFSINRTDLLSTTGTEPMQKTHSVGQELIKPEADPDRLGEMPDQIATIMRAHPAGHPLDFALNGDVRRLTGQDLRNAFGNLARLASAA